MIVDFCGAKVVGLKSRCAVSHWRRHTSGVSKYTFVSTTSSEEVPGWVRVVCLLKGPSCIGFERFLWIMVDHNPRVGG